MATRASHFGCSSFVRRATSLVGSFFFGATRHSVERAIYFFRFLLTHIGNVLHSVTTMNKSNNRIGRRLKAYRMDRKWPLRRMAALTGLSISTVWSIERGHTGPSDISIAKLRDSLPGLFKSEQSQHLAED